MRINNRSTFNVHLKMSVIFCTPPPLNFLMISRFCTPKFSCIVLLLILLYNDYFITGRKRILTCLLHKYPKFYKSYSFGGNFVCHPQRYTQIYRYRPFSYPLDPLIKYAISILSNKIELGLKICNKWNSKNLKSIFKLFKNIQFLFSRS